MRRDENRLRGSKRHKLKTIEADEATLLDFFTHARSIPGQVQPGHFERWANHLYQERKVAASTQRGYQNTVRLFFDYVLGQPRLRNVIRCAMGQEAVQVATPCLDCSCWCTPALPVKPAA